MQEKLQLIQLKKKFQHIHETEIMKLFDCDSMSHVQCKVFNMDMCRGGLSQVTVLDRLTHNTLPDAQKYLDSINSNKNKEDKENKESTENKNKNANNDGIDENKG